MTTYAQQASSGKGNSNLGNNASTTTSGSNNNNSSNGGGGHHPQQQQHHHHHHHSHHSNGNNNTHNTNNNSELTKKEEFRKYLEQTGVLDSLTKALIGLYEEPQPRPSNAIEYVQRYMVGGGQLPTNVDVDGLRRENEQLKQEVERLRSNSYNSNKGLGGAGNK